MATRLKPTDTASYVTVMCKFPAETKSGVMQTLVELLSVKITASANDCLRLKDRSFGLGFGIVSYGFSSCFFRPYTASCFQSTLFIGLCMKFEFWY